MEVLSSEEETAPMGRHEEGSLETNISIMSNMFPGWSEGILSAVVLSTDGNLERAAEIVLNHSGTGLPPSELLSSICREAGNKEQETNEIREDFRFNTNRSNEGITSRSGHNSLLDSESEPQNSRSTTSIPDRQPSSTESGSKSTSVINVINSSGEGVVVDLEILNFLREERKQTQRNNQNQILQSTNSIDGKPPSFQTSIPLSSSDGITAGYPELNDLVYDVDCGEHSEAKSGPLSRHAYVSSSQSPPGDAINPGAAAKRKGNEVGDHNDACSSLSSGCESNQGGNVSGTCGIHISNLKCDDAEVEIPISSPSEMEHKINSCTSFLPESFTSLAIQDEGDAENNFVTSDSRNEWLSDEKCEHFDSHSLTAVQGGYSRHSASSHIKLEDHKTRMRLQSGLMEEGMNTKSDKDCDLYKSLGQYYGERLYEDDQRNNNVNAIMINTNESDLVPMPSSLNVNKRNARSELNRRNLFPSIQNINNVNTVNESQNRTEGLYLRQNNQNNIMKHVEVADSAPHLGYNSCDSNISDEYKYPCTVNLISEEKRNIVKDSLPFGESSITKSQLEEDRTQANSIQNQVMCINDEEKDDSIHVKGSSQNNISHLMSRKTRSLKKGKVTISNMTEKEKDQLLFTMLNEERSHASPIGDIEPPKGNLHLGEQQLDAMYPSYFSLLKYQREMNHSYSNSGSQKQKQNDFFDPLTTELIKQRETDDLEKAVTESLSEYQKQKIQRNKISEMDQIVLQRAVTESLLCREKYAGDISDDVNPFFKTEQHSSVSKIHSSFNAARNHLAIEEDLPSNVSSTKVDQGFVTKSFGNNVPQTLDVRIPSDGSQQYLPQLNSKCSQDQFHQNIRNGTVETPRLPYLDSIGSSCDEDLKKAVQASLQETVNPLHVKTESVEENENLKRAIAASLLETKRPPTNRIPFELQGIRRDGVTIEKDLDVNAPPLITSNALETSNEYQSYYSDSKSTSSTLIRSTSRMSIQHPPGSFVIVQEAGVKSVNGTYLKVGTCNGVGMYCKDAIWEGNVVRYTLYRCLLSNRDRKWFISIVPDDIKPGTDEDKDFYFAQSTFDLDLVEKECPPESGWILAPFGQNPVPSCLHDVQSHPPKPTYTDCKSIIVESAGWNDVNGTYVQTDMHDDVGVYTKESFWHGRKVLLALFRSTNKFEHNSQRWFLSVLSQDSNPGSNADTDLYTVKVPTVEFNCDKPPISGWTTTVFGKAPPPKCFDKRDTATDISIPESVSSQHWNNDSRLCDQQPVKNVRQGSLGGSSCTESVINYLPSDQSFTEAFSIKRGFMQVADEGSGTRMRKVAMCILCRARPVTYVLVPCGHPCLCDSCATPDVALSFHGLCPIGRCKVDSVMRFYGTLVEEK